MMMPPILQSPKKSAAFSPADLQIVEKVGSGSFGVVYKAIHVPTGAVYAIKRIPLTNLTISQQRKAVREALTQAKTDHPNIIKCIANFVNDGALNLVVEFAPGGDLLSLIEAKKTKGKAFPEETLWRFAHDLTHALDYLHSHGIIHRDIKCQNILVGADQTLKIADLGLAISDAPPGNTSYAGTQAYFAPEILQEKPFDTKVDIWALGCVLFYLAHFVHPFDNPDYLTLVKNVVQKEAEMVAGYSEGFEKLISKMLRKDPKERPNAKELLADIHFREGFTKCELNTKRTTLPECRARRPQKWGLNKTLLLGTKCAAGGRRNCSLAPGATGGRFGDLQNASEITKNPLPCGRAAKKQSRNVMKLPPLKLADVVPCQGTLREIGIGTYYLSKRGSFAVQPSKLTVLDL